MCAALLYRLCGDHSTNTTPQIDVSTCIEKTMRCMSAGIEALMKCNNEHLVVAYLSGSAIQSPQRPLRAVSVSV